MSDSLWPHGLQHARPLCLLFSLGACSSSRPVSWWCYLTILSSAAHFSFCLQSPSIRVFFSESALCSRWPKYWSFSISPSSEYSWLISFRIDWFDLAVQGNLKSLIQHHSSKASVLQCSAFFMFRLSHLYVIIGKKLLLTFVLLHFVLHGQTCLIPGFSWFPTFAFQSPVMKRTSFFDVSSRRSYRSS